MHSSPHCTRRDSPLAENIYDLNSSAMYLIVARGASPQARQHFESASAVRIATIAATHHPGGVGGGA